MFGKRFVTMLLCFAFFSIETAIAQDAVLSLRWAELGPAVVNKKVYAVGQASIARVDVFQVWVKRVKGPGRAIGAAGPGSAGALISMAVALDDSGPSNDQARGVAAIVVTAASIVGGYMLGRLADGHETLITIVPE